MEVLKAFWLETRRRAKIVDSEDMEDIDANLRGLARGVGGGRTSVKRDL